MIHDWLRSKGGPSLPAESTASSWLLDHFGCLLILNLLISIFSLSIHLLSKLMCMYCSCQVNRRGITVNLYVFFGCRFAILLLISGHMM